MDATTSKTAKRTRPARKLRVGEFRAVTYRAYPTARQDQVLDELLLWQRRLYNAALEDDVAPGSSTIGP